MGKAKILEAHGEGRYTIQIIEARERAESAKGQARARINERQLALGNLDEKIQQAGAAVDEAVAEQNAAIAQYKAEGNGGDIGELTRYAAAVMEAARARDALKMRRRALETTIASDRALIARVDALPPLRQMQAWCADYTEDLSGTVATAEVPGEIGQVIITPGGSGSEGAMQPALASTPAGTFYNLAMMPGWQKWRPTFRVATITALNGDQCDIILDSASSSQQGLNVNARDSYSGVPILYMDCDGGAFEEGDRVLVAFAGNVDGPTVVGFERDPKPCEACIVVSVPVYERYESSLIEHGVVVDEPAQGCYLANYETIDFEYSVHGTDMITLGVRSSKKPLRVFSSDALEVLEGISTLEQLAPYAVTERENAFGARYSYYKQRVDQTTRRIDTPCFIDSSKLMGAAPFRTPNGINSDYRFQGKNPTVEREGAKAYKTADFQAQIGIASKYGIFEHPYPEGSSDYIKYYGMALSTDTSGYEVWSGGLGDNFLSRLPTVSLGRTYFPAGVLKVVESDDFYEKEYGFDYVNSPAVLEGRYNVLVLYERAFPTGRSG